MIPVNKNLTDEYRKYTDRQYQDKVFLLFSSFYHTLQVFVTIDSKYYPLPTDDRFSTP